MFKQTFLFTIPILFIVSFTEIALGQCELVTEDGVYPATCFKEFTSDPDTYDGIDIFIPSLSIVKMGQGKARIIVKEPFGGNFQNVYLYLDNNEIIKLIDRDIQWTVNDETFYMYYLTQNELSKLKSHNIRALRYKSCSTYEFDCKRKGMTEIYNRSFSYYSTRTYERRNHKRVDFPELINKLF